MSAEFAIEISGLRKDYGKVQALRGVELTVHKGELFGFLGPNGAGKTTTIRCMLDLIRPQAGSIRLLGIALLLALLAWWRFERRDVRVGGEGGWRLPILARRGRAALR